MAHRKSQYGAAVRYKGKLVGRCTVSDSEALAVYMKECANNALFVLVKYDHFSPELRGILEKIQDIQSAEYERSPAGRLFSPPRTSPWGEVQHCETICPGVFMVSTPGHGGIMVAQDAAAFLSPAARKCGFRKGGYICFEEDSQEAVALRELMDKGLWSPTHTTNKAGYEERLNERIREYNPDYWRSREGGRQRAVHRRDAPTRPVEAGATR